MRFYFIKFQFYVQRKNVFGGQPNPSLLFIFGHANFDHLKTIFGNDQSSKLNLVYLNIVYLNLGYLNLVYLNIVYLNLVYLNIVYLI